MATAHHSGEDWLSPSSTLPSSSCCKKSRQIFPSLGPSSGQQPALHSSHSVSSVLTFCGASDFGENTRGHSSSAQLTVDTAAHVLRISCNGNNSTGIAPNNISHYQDYQFQHKHVIITGFYSIVTGLVGGKYEICHTLCEVTGRCECPLKTRPGAVLACRDISSHFATLSAITRH